MTTDRSQGPLVRGLFEGYGRGDADAVREALSPDLVAYVTTADGGADRVEGRDAYLDRLPDLRAAPSARSRVTQVLEVNEALVMAMVEAQPAHSDEFWSS